MIDGIIVLNTTALHETPTWIPVITCALAILSCAFLYVWSRRGNIIFPIMGFIFFAAFLTFSILVVTDFPFKSTERNKYECIIEDQVTFNDVHDNYDVIERHGDIWILKDKVR